MLEGDLSGEGLRQTWRQQAGKGFRPAVRPLRPRDVYDGCILDIPIIHFPEVTQ